MHQTATTGVSAGALERHVHRPGDDRRLGAALCDVVHDAFQPVPR